MPNLRAWAKMIDEEYAGDRIPSGTRVRYQGSVHPFRGKEMVVGPLPEGYPRSHENALALYWSDVPGEQDPALWNVRPKSVEVIKLSKENT